MKKILLIEDDAPLSWLLGKILKSRYEVTIINNEMDAWAWLSERNTPDLIVYDINSEAADGIEFLQNIRLSGLLNDIPVVVLSGILSEEQRQKCLDLGVFSFISKPFEPQSFLSSIKSGLLHKNEVVFTD